MTVSTYETKESLVSIASLPMESSATFRYSFVLAAPTSTAIALCKSRMVMSGPRYPSVAIALCFTRLSRTSVHLRRNEMMSG